MIGLKMTSTTFNQALVATKAAPAGGDFVWDGQDEDERPLGKDEMLAGIAVARRRRGRPAGSGTKEQVAIRLDHDVLAARAACVQLQCPRAFRLCPTGARLHLGRPKQSLHQQA